MSTLLIETNDFLELELIRFRCELIAFLPDFYRRPLRSFLRPRCIRIRIFSFTHLILNFGRITLAM